MILSKLNKFFILSILFCTLFSCVKNNKIITQEKQSCIEESQINIYNSSDSIIVFFNGKYKGKSFKNLNIEHSRNNKKIDDAGFRLTKENYVKISGNITLESKDFLKVIFSDGETIKITEFQNEPYFGGKKFLGCFLGSCLVDGKLTKAKNEINIYK